jgi:pimeloyl-ACP methyl ester carboxylesterase
VSDPEWADVDLDAFSRITVPVLLTQGDQSPPFFSKIIAQLAEAIEGAEVRTLPGAGHVPHMTHPAEYVAVLRDRPSLIDRSSPVMISMRTLLSP